MRSSTGIKVFAFAVLAGCQAPLADQPVASGDDALLGAPVDARARGFAVGVCTGPLNTDPASGPVGTCRRGTAKCSGTLVAPNLVLTARHCVHLADEGPNVKTNPCDTTFGTTPTRPGGTRVTTAPSVSVGAPAWYDVAEILVPDGNRGCRDDVALLVLDRRVPGSEAFPVDVDLRDVGQRPPREVAMLGRGMLDMTYALDAKGDWTGALASSDQGDLLRRVAEHLPVLCATNGPSSCVVTSHEVPAPRLFTLPLEMFVIGGTPVTAGDSGGGVYDQRLFGTLGGRLARVVGVATWGFIGPDGKPKDGGVQRLDVHAQFLREGAWKAARRGRYLMPRWAEDEHPGGG